MLASHGKLRVSEPLRAVRRDLLLPVETGSEIRSLFLNVEKSKTSFRGKAVVQHTRVSDDLTIPVAERVLGLLHPAAPSTYRRRWDSILACLRLDKSWKLTPGTLRAGGAIFAYHQGIQVTEILRLMRLKSLTTLESYLQSTAALNVVLRLPETTRSTIHAFAQFLPFLLRHS